MSSSNKDQKKFPPKRIAAIIGIVLLILLYLLTLVLAILDSSATGQMFMVSLTATMVVPIMIWIYIWMYGKLTGRHTIADFDNNAPQTKETAPGEAPGSGRE